MTPRRRRRRGEFRKLAAIGRGQSHRFFHEQVFTSAKGGPPHLDVQVRGQHYADGLDVGPLEQLAIVGDNRGLWMTVQPPRAAGCIRFCHRRKPGGRALCDYAGMVAAPGPVTDYTKTDLPHDRVRLLWIVNGGAASQTGLQE